VTGAFELTEALAANAVFTTFAVFAVFGTLDFFNFFWAILKIFLGVWSL
jgi:hypothetical protein